MDNFTDDLEKKQELDTTSRMKDFVSDIKPAIPDNLSMDTIAAYINERYPDLKSQLNSLGTMEKVGLSMACQKFPGLKSIVDAIQGVPNAVQGVKDAPGYANVPQDMPDYQDDHEVIPDELFDEAMDYAYERYLKEDSFARICEGLQVNYGINIAPVELSRRLKALHIAKEYESEHPDSSDAQNANLMTMLSKRLKEIEELKSKNIELEKKQAIHEALKEKENPSKPPERVGLIRWIARKLY